MRDYHSVRELIALADGGRISDAVCAQYARAEHVSEETVRARMRENLNVMRESVLEGLNPALLSMSGMVGGQAAKYRAAVAAGKTVGGGTLGRAGAYALAAAECNACMGRIVAAPTAGACGILPAALFAAQEDKGYTDEELVAALFNAAGIGRVIAQKAGISGAEGGCQAECGTASAMAASALAELGGGGPEACESAAAFALVNVMGLACDPVNGLVEIPCVYRNVMGVANAMTAADMALSGIRMPLDADDVIDAVRRVGRALPESLRETGIGGCAACKVRKAEGNKP